MRCDETVTEEHDRLQRRTNELCNATKALPLSLTTAEHEAVAAALREHHSALLAHTERQTREHHLRQL